MNPREPLARVLIVGPTPPPFHGVATFIRDLLLVGQTFLSAGNDAQIETDRQECLPHQFILEHLDTSDRRDAANLGCWDIGNLTLGFANLAELTARLLRRRHKLVYVPISQNIPAFLRDALFIWQSRLLGTRVVVQLHGGHFREFYDKAPALFRWLARTTLRRCARVIVLSEVFRALFKGIVPDAQVTVVENGVHDFAPPIAPHAETPETILFMSSLARSKGILKLIEAFVQVHRSRPEARLRIAGTWTEPDTQREALALIERENLQDHVVFAGNVDGAAKRDFMANGTLFCLPTFYPYEGQPLVILEALAAGLPVISTRHAAIPRTIDDGITGILLDPACSANQLAEALTSLVNDPETLRRMTHAARTAFETRYTLAHCHARLFAIFEQVH